VEIYAMAFNFNCRFEFSKALINYNSYEFVLHNGGIAKVDVIETILNNDNEREQFSQTAIDFCLSLVSKNLLHSFIYISDFAIGIREKINLIEREPSIRVPRSENTSISIDFIRKLKSNEQKIISSLLNDAHYSNNPFFKFLCYWKILEVPIKSKSRNAEKWINDLIINNPSIIRSNDKLYDMYKSGVNIGYYFREQCRNAISHISKPPYLTSNNFKHFMQVTRACSFIFIFVKYFIMHEIFWERYQQKVNILSIVK